MNSLWPDMFDLGAGPWGPVPWWAFWRYLRGQRWRRRVWVWDASRGRYSRRNWRYCRDVDFLLMN